MASDPEFDSSAYYAPCLQSGSVQGEQYALPQESVPTIMFVNKTLLESRGIPLPDNRWTWEDFYEICARVTDVDSRTSAFTATPGRTPCIPMGPACFPRTGRPVIWRTSGSRRRSGLPGAWRS